MAALAGSPRQPLPQHHNLLRGRRRVIQLKDPMARAKKRADDWLRVKETEGVTERQMITTAMP